MRSKVFQKNAILSGYFESYCLACDNFLPTQENVVQHIEKPIHVKKLESLPYLEQYQADHIRKVKHGYFCELCNVLEPTMMKMSFHIEKASHIEQKKAAYLKLVENGVQVFGEIVIDNETWHGLTEACCVICNVECSNLKIHMSEKTHLLKLVQCEVEFGENKSIYRKIDDSCAHCLTCNSMINGKLLTDHFNDPKHIEMYNGRRIPSPALKEVQSKLDEEDKKVINNINTKAAEEEPKRDEPEPKKSVAATSLSRDEAKTVDNDNKVATETALVKYTEKVESSGDDARTFAKEHNLTYNQGNNDAYCRLCTKHIPATLRSMKEHIFGKDHTKKAQMQAGAAGSRSPRIPKKKTGDFIEFIHFVENPMFDKEAVLNLKLVVSQSSLGLVMASAGWIRCLACDKALTAFVVVHHIESESHRDAVSKVPVLTGLQGEFVREVGPEKYHCGFCEEVLSPYKALEAHLHGTAHHMLRARAEVRLNNLKPQIHMHELERNIFNHFRQNFGF